MRSRLIKMMYIAALDKKYNLSMCVIAKTIDNRLWLNLADSPCNQVIDYNYNDQCIKWRTLQEIIDEQQYEGNI